MQFYGSVTLDSVKIKAFKTAFPYTVPIGASFIFLGASYGFLMVSKGFSPLYPFFMSLLIFAGSVEFVSVTMLLGSFEPVSAFLAAFMLNARHLFYAVSMLKPYNVPRWKKLYLIFGMCDESFAINSMTKVPDGVDRSWFMLFVTMLNHFYWVAGATLGAVVGSAINFPSEGIEFVLPALFLVIFAEQWLNADAHGAALTGLAASVLSLFVFGTENFMIPAMLMMLLVFAVIKRRAQ
jgi:4-azaleucine resistance transporter AzlC